NAADNEDAAAARSAMRTAAGSRAAGGRVREGAVMSVTIRVLPIGELCPYRGGGPIRPAPGAPVARNLLGISAPKELRLELVLVPQLVDLRAVALREPRGLSDVALRHREQVRQVFELEAIARLRKRQELLLFAPQRPLDEARRNQRRGREHDA